MPRCLALLLLLLACLAPGHAKTILSPGAESVAITVYRQPGRSSGAIDRKWPGGYALVTETRTLDLPRGDSVVRFEGVAEGLMPETAVLSGMPRGVREKNRDARLLSPAGLVDAYLKRSVTLRRTDLHTGKVTDQDAIISAGPTGGVILQTAQGYEALGCSGLPERMLYARAPADLSPRPTLSVIATSDRAVRATVQLTYLAQGFDWTADYVARMRPDGRSLDLMAWLTVANGGVTGFSGARLNVIAGQPNRRARSPGPRPVSDSLHLTCWPMDVTSTYPRWGLPPLDGPTAAMMERAQSIVVTGLRRTEMPAMLAAPAPPAPPPPPPPPEDVGDLKLYRVPVAVDVAASGQKQVALLRQQDVQAERLYAATVGLRDGAGDSRPMTLRLRLQNRKDAGLGLALPSGRVALFEDVGGASLLVGEANVADKAEGERVDYDIATSADVRLSVRRLPVVERARQWMLVVSNARPFPVEAEVTIPHNIDPRPAGLERRGNAWIWRVSVPAGDSVEYRYAERRSR